MTRNSEDIINSNDYLTDLLRGFQSRNEFRSDPNYVLEPVDLTAAVPERFAKILRETSYGSDYHTEAAAPVEQIEDTPVEPNPALILLAEQYDKNSQTKLARARVFSAVAAGILISAVIIFSLLAEFVVAGILVAVVAVAMFLFSRNSAKQAEEIQQIATVLAQPDEAV